MNAPTNALAIRPSSLMDPVAFEHMQRVGKVLALSPLFPEHLRKGSVETGIANGVLVLNMATRLNEDVLTVAQNIYFVGGKPGWSASYMIGKANQHGVFRDPIDWDVKGKGDDLSVTAFAILSATGKRVAVTCDMKMAKAEGWTKNTKYQSMPEQMLRYRSGTFLIRLYCPEVMIGVPSTIELELGMRDVTPDYVPQVNAEAGETAIEGEVITPDGEVVQAKESAPAKADKPAAAAKAKPAAPAPEQTHIEQEQPGLDLDAPDAAGDLGEHPKWGETVTQMRRYYKSGEEAVLDLFSGDLDQIKADDSDLFTLLMQELSALPKPE